MGCVTVSPKLEGFSIDIQVKHLIYYTDYNIPIQCICMLLYIVFILTLIVDY